MTLLLIGQLMDRENIISSLFMKIELDTMPYCISVCVSVEIVEELPWPFSKKKGKEEKKKKGGGGGLWPIVPEYRVIQHIKLSNIK